MRNMLTLIFSLFLISNAYASDFNWPDANNLSYPEYEVNIVNDYKNSVDEAITNRKLLDFALNFNFDLKTHKNKIYSILIFNKLARKLEKNEKIVYGSKKTEYSNFILENEFSSQYDDEAIFKKLKTWMLLRYGYWDLETTSNDEYNKLKERRKNILKTVIENNKDYSPLASYILVDIDGDLTTFNSTDEELQKKIDELQAFIEKFPDSDFVPLIRTDIAYQYVYGKKYDKAIQLCKEIIQKHKNFCNGEGDIYSIVYTNILLKVYKALNNKDDYKQILNLINKNTENYDNILKFSTNYLSK